MDNRLVICLRELSSLKKEKTILLALLIQLFIASFSSFLVVGLVSLYSPQSNIGVEIGVTGDHSKELASISKNTTGISVTKYSRFSSAYNDFKSGHIDAVLEADSSRPRISITSIIPESSFKTTFIVVQIKSVLKKYEKYKRNQYSEYLKYDLIDLPRKTTSSPYFQFSYTVLIPLLVFLPIVIGGSVASDFITEEFEKDTIELLRVSPLNDMEIFDGKMLAMVILSTIQVCIWFILLNFNNLVIFNIVLLLFLVFSLSVIAVVVGSIIGLIYRDRRQTQFIYSFCIIVFFILSNILPESIGNTVSKLAIGSETIITQLSVLIYLILAISSYIGFYIYVKKYNKFYLK